MDPGAVRKKLQMKPREFAELFEVSIHDVIGWEEGTITPSPLAVKMLILLNNHSELVKELPKNKKRKTRIRFDDLDKDE